MSAAQEQSSETREFKYDVAISFLDANDAALASRIAEGLRDRFEVFIYTEQQRELVGKDGVEAFAKVFGEEARVVVVLHRDMWGTTKWTRVEHDAIKGRAFDLGWDFLVFIPLDDKPKLPPWFPRTRLYHGMKRFGVEGALAVIEQRIGEAGGEPHPPTLADVAAKKLREREHAKQREQFRERRALGWALSETKTLPEISAELVQGVPQLGLQFGERKEYRVEVRVPNGPWLIVRWDQVYSNSLDGAGLVVSVWHSHPQSLEAQFENPRPEALSRSKYTPDLGSDGKPAWFDNDGRQWTLRQVVEEGMKDLVQAMPGGPE